MFEPLKYLGFTSVEDVLNKKYDLKYGNSASPQATTNKIAEPIKTTTVIGYVLLASVVLYFGRKVME